MAEGVRQGVSDEGQFAVAARYGEFRETTPRKSSTVFLESRRKRRSGIPHLEKFRKGWENEHLATFLLSRMSFVANPIKVADDIGTDLFCTLFEITEGELFPRNSFAIQTKSSMDQIDATGKIEYFEKLELPFFVGVVDQGNLRLSIYSGEYLPIFFAHHGIPQGLKLSLEDTAITFDNYCEVRPEGKYVLRMPHLLDLEGQEDSDAVAGKGSHLIQLCSRMLQNISSRRNCEYVFHLGDGRVAIFAGPGSAQTFRSNFYYRLAELFYNFEWLYRNNPDGFNIAEYQVFEQCYHAIKNAGQLPIVVSMAYESIRRRLTTDAQHS
jgi:hypothetical protein